MHSEIIPYIHRSILFIIFIIMAESSDAQIKFEISFGGEGLIAGKQYYYKKIKDSIKIEQLRFYISEMKIYSGKEEVGKAAKEHILVDLADLKTIRYLITDKLKTPDRIQFKLGIDSLTSSSGAFGGDLDPTNGLYWTWQSGYINFKLEGKTAACPARNNLFQYHIGGYQYPFNAMREVELDIEKGGEILIEFPIEELLNNTDLSKEYEIMSPNKKAMRMADLIAKNFRIKK